MTHYERAVIWGQIVMATKDIVKSAENEDLNECYLNLDYVEQMLYKLEQDTSTPVNPENK